LRRLRNETSLPFIQPKNLPADPAATVAARSKTTSNSSWTIFKALGTSIVEVFYESLSNRLFRISNIELIFL
jgi:hypothetical protein